MARRVGPSDLDLGAVSTLTCREPRSGRAPGAGLITDWSGRPEGL
jgi:hypothetical protein